MLWNTHIFLVAHIQFLKTFLFVSVMQGIMNQLSDVMYRFNFSLPPQYALVIRALGSLEGTATVLDPQFKVVASAYPFIIGRLLADPDPQMRKILRELLIRNNGSIRWNRLERLVLNGMLSSIHAPCNGLSACVDIVHGGYSCSNSIDRLIV